ncbi:MAG: xanthine dehydrogenase family protein molybdopterin-binding subunit [Anaerolineae bacterium]
MAIKEHVDVWRAVQEPAYAARLTNDQWRELLASPDWDELTGEFPELAEAFIAANQDKLARYAGIGTSRGVAPNPSLAAEELSVVGKDHEFVQWQAIYNGTAEYSVNKVLPNMLFMKTLRSPHPRALVKAVDASQAEALPGVVAVLHRFNLPEEYRESRIAQFGWSPGPTPRYLFSEEINQVGQPVAVVAAETEHIADEAIQLIEVEYEVLPAVLDFMEGMLPSTPKQWDNKYDGTIVDIREQVRGDPEAGFAEADAVVEGTTTRSTEQNAPLELTSGLFWWENERLNFIWQPRYTHAERDRIARPLNLRSNQVRGIQLGYVGASYGSHRNMDVGEVHAAILAKLTGRPVKAVMTRSEDFVFRTVRAAERTEAKLGVKKDGTFVAATFKTISDAGAATRSWSTGAWIGLQTLYTIPNLGLEAVGVWTNSFRAGTFRCVSHPYATQAQETLVDKAAYAIGMNPLDIRLQNINEEGHPDTERPYSNPGLRDCITQATDRIGWARKWHAPGAEEVRPGVFHGIGMAAHTCSHGGGSHPSTGGVIVHTDGTLTVQSAANDIGCGQRTLMRMIAAETLGIPYEQTSISLEVDTDVTPNTGGTFGSRMTNSGGWGVYEAAMDAKRQLLEGAAEKFVADEVLEKVTPEELDIRDGSVFFKEDPEIQMEVADAVGAVVPRSPVIGRGAHFHPPDWTRLAFAAHAAEVEVDTATGTVTVLNYVAAHDIGRALNPQAVEQQIQGGVTMALSHTLFEGLFIDQATGLPLTDNILEYKMISIRDVPRSIDVIMVERPKEYGVYGAHGIGEPPIAVPAPTIINAVYNAIGVWVESLPISRDKILTALGAV